jgi:integrase/recombinase XerD
MDAIQHFEAEMPARNLQESSQKKYKSLNRQLQGFATDNGIRMVSQFDLSLLEKFRQGWKDSPISATKKLERLRCVFRFFVDHGWMEKNETLKLRPPKFKQVPTMPFTVDQMRCMIDTCDVLPENTRNVSRDMAQRLKALCLVMRYSGLRIGDAASLACDRLDGSKLFLYTAKTGTPVFTKLPDFVVAELDRVARVSPAYWFWTGHGLKETLTGNYRRSFRRMLTTVKHEFMRASLKHAHPHRFRDTFAVELLLADVPIQDVSTLLGHDSIETTEEHYSPWVKARQVRLETNLDKALAGDPLAQSETAKVQKLVRVK